MENQTYNDCQKIIAFCKDIFTKKHCDYGNSWKTLRIGSVIDQILIKAMRTRSIQEKKKKKINEDMSQEYIGIINYSIIFLIQLETENHNREMDLKEISDLYDRFSSKSIALMKNKNHDYDEAWRLMRVESITDIILMKLLRLRKIEENQRQVKYSEGMAEGVKDIINYALFALLHLNFLDIER